MDFVRVHPVIRKLRNLRYLHGYSLDKTADLMGVSRKTIHNYETGKTSPRLKDLVKYSELFGVSMHCLFEEDHGSSGQAA